jgi:PAS domain S-box-containing protein
MQVFYAVTRDHDPGHHHALTRERRNSLEALAQSRADLAQAHDELEQRVAERTATLDSALRELRETGEAYSALFENAAEGIYRADASGRFVAREPALARMLGYASPDDLMAHITDIWRQVFTCDDSRRRLYETLATKGRATDFEMPVRTRSGGDIWSGMSVRPVQDDQGRVLGMDGIVQDITQRKLSQEELERRATRDPLTGAANRHTFEQRPAPDAGPGRARRRGAGPCFSWTGRLQGHQRHPRPPSRGPRSAHRGRAHQGPAARDRPAGPPGRRRIRPAAAQRDRGPGGRRRGRDILRALGEPVEFEGLRLTVGASGGGCLTTGSGPDADMDALLHRADQAMYHAKQQGKNRSHIDAA